MTSDKIPLAFRAQIENRCQIQRLIPKKPRQEAYDWVEQWIDAAATETPKFGANVKTKEYKITWRFVANSGQDEGVIRPAIASKGWPYYPGSSMKGAFRRACSNEQAARYCGSDSAERETKPGILRFHGGYPKDDSWAKNSLVDVVHPQEGWQLKNNQAKHSALIQISLYEPTLVFGISSTIELSEEEWATIWSIWEIAMERGIGSRVSAGYGQVRSHKSNNLLSVGLQGQGLASQLIDKTGEFRPNMFKAALRGHCLRLFSGVTDERTAEELTKELWGGLGEKDKAVVGLLGIAFNPVELEIDTYRYDNNSMPTYGLLGGTLNILAMRELSEKESKNLKLFVTQLIKFSMLLGGFGKSWRRADHRLFFADYVKNNANPLIGCHWQFLEKSQKLYCPINQLADIGTFLNNLRDKSITGWVKLKGKQPSGALGSWRETWHPQNVQVWARFAQDEEDSAAIYWFHDAYAKNKSIKNSDLTGKIGQIGRIWHRMYPHYVAAKDGSLKATGKYVEILTIFPDVSDTTQEFIKFLGSREFKKVWPLEK